MQALFEAFASNSALVNALGITAVVLSAAALGISIRDTRKEIQKRNKKK